MPLGIKPTVDFAFKKIFGSPENVQVLIGLLNAILQLRRPITHVTILNPFSYQDFADDKQIVLDIRARDVAGRWLNIEMQVSIVTGLLQRMVYYACSLYSDQLKSGEGYSGLKPAISICLLGGVLFPETSEPHHRFRLCDPERGKELPELVEVHTVELTKYNLDEVTINRASKIEQWAFFLLFADQCEPDRLRELLPGVEFDQAISMVETISQKTEDRTMYDRREKAQRDYEWGLAGAREEGLEMGREQGLQEGRQEGLQEGREQGLQEGREAGEALGLLVGSVVTLQRIAGEAESAIDELRKLDTVKLQCLISELQERLRSRG